MKWQPRQLLAVMLGVVVAIGVPTCVTFNRKPLPPDELQPAQVLGKPLRLQTAAGERILMLSQQYGVHWYWGHGSGGRRWGHPASEQVINIDLWAFEPGKAQPLWRRRFKNNTPGAMTSVGDVLQGQGDSVWLALREPVRVAATDGRLLTAAPLAGETMRGDEVHDLRDRQARGLRAGSRWIGVLTEAEHGKLAGPGGEDWRPDALGVGGGDDDYMLWSARVRDVPGNSGKQERYSDFRPLGAPARFHRAGLLTLGQRSAPLVLTAPNSVVLLHRGRDADGARLSLARIEAGEGSVLWSVADLPIARLRHLLPGEADLALVGEGPRPPTGPGAQRPDPEHWLILLDLVSGRQETFNLARASLTAEPVPLE